MTEQWDSPDDSEVREMPVTSDSALSADEKEVRIVGINSESEMVCSTEVPTISKWLQSIEVSTVDWVRVEDGHIIGVKARIPKGIIKLQGSARKADTHSQMVTYGDADE